MNSNFNWKLIWEMAVIRFDSLQNSRESKINEPKNAEKTEILNSMRWKCGEWKNELMHTNCAGAPN